MLAVILFYLLIFTITSYKLLRKDIFAPSVITGIIFSFGTVIAIIGNINWKVNVSFQVLLVYVLGTSSLLMGELALLNKKLNIVNRVSLTQRYKISEIVIPKNMMILLLAFSFIVVCLSKIKATEIAYANGYRGLSWQSMPVYVKQALMNGNASFGFPLSLFRQLVENITYLGLFIFIVNCCVIGVKLTIKKHFWLLTYVVPYAYMLSLQGQRSNFIGVISFCFYVFVLQNKHLQLKVNYRKIMICGGVFVSVFLLYFVVIGNLTGRAANSNSLENLYIYIGSSIIDFADYLNSDLDRYSYTFGTQTFAGFFQTVKRFIPFLPMPVRNPNSYGFGFVEFPNGSQSNVYGPYAIMFSEFSYIGVFVISFLLGGVYRLFYNLVNNNSSTQWDIYLFSFISYGIVIAFINEQQLFLMFSIYQIMHLIIAYVVLNYCFRKYNVLSAKMLFNKNFFLYRLK